LVTSLIPRRPFTLLDYGCGPGDLLNHVGPMTRFITHYRGVDINPAFIDRAQRVYKSWRWVSFMSGDVLDDQFNSILDTYRVVVASGVLCYLAPQYRQAQLAILQRLWNRTEDRLIFNVLKRGHSPELDEKHATFRLKDVADIVDTLNAERWQILHDHLSNDITVMLSREPW